LVDLNLSDIFQALKVLRTAEFAPFVVFIAAPSMSALAELKNINVSASLLTQFFRIFSIYTSPLNS
jgi:hypothetical protein